MNKKTNPVRVLKAQNGVAILCFGIMRLNHMIRSTEEIYLYYILDYIYFHNKHHPLEMGVDEICECLSHLALYRNVAASIQNIALSALLFVYRQELKSDMPDIGNIERAKRWFTAMYSIGVGKD